VAPFRRFKDFVEDRRLARRAGLPPALVSAARSSGLFDEHFYLKTYPDVAGNRIDPLEHYLTFGLSEKRKPSAVFDPTAYLEANPAGQASGMEPFVHYLLAGRAANAPLSRSETIEPRPSLTNEIVRGTERLIIFLTPGLNARAGGILSIASIYEETKTLADLHGAKLAVCAVPGDDPFFLKYDWFENDIYLLDLHAVLRGCENLRWLQLHVPEYAVKRVSDWLEVVFGSLLRAVRDIHVNIMLQNIDYIEVQDVPGLMRFGRVTATTAHQAYGNARTRALLGVPVHQLGVRLGPELYAFKPYREKQDLLVVSPDPHPLRDQVLTRIACAHPNLKIQVIADLTYESYKALICDAKWSLTFGEGLDGYFVEPIFSGAVSFAVYNERFFTSAFAELETVYPSWDALGERMAADIHRLDDPERFERGWRPAYDLLASIYDTEHFRASLRAFYREDYSFP